MKKRLFGILIGGLFFINIINVVYTTLVFADSSIEQKVDIDSFKASENSIVENEIIVKYKSKESNSKILSYFFGFKKSESKVEKIKVDNRKDLLQRIEELKSDSNVEFIQPNYKYEKFDLVDSNISNNAITMTTASGISDKQWYLNNFEIPQVWNQSTGKDVTVAVIDTGIDSSHEDLVDKVKGGQDFTGTGSYLDNNGHGTLIAGIIAADRKNNIGVTGVAYDSKLLSVKVLNEYGIGDTVTISKGVRWAADNGAKILNISLGTTEDDTILKEAVDYAVSKGCIISAASGNYGFQKLTYPAAYDNVIAVGSTNEANQWCYFSSYGKEVDVVAPGTKIYSTVPENIDIAKYKVSNGTSASAAIVTGQVALMVSKEPRLTVSDVLNKIKVSSFALSDSSPDIFHGYGILDIKKVITGLSGKLLIKTAVSDDNNTIIKAQTVSSPKTLINKLNCDSDVNWYKISIPSDSVAKFTFNTVDSGIYAHVFSDKFSLPDNIFFIVDQSQYYISNYNKDKTEDYYLEVYNPYLEKSNCNMNIQYLSAKDASITKDSSLKYCIDSPKQGQIVTGDTLDLSGWAISKLGLATAKVMIDDQVMDINVGLKRLDVFEAFSDYGDENSGFSGSLDLSNFSYGKHKLKLIFTDCRGVIKFSNPITFTIVDTLKYSIDTVKPGMSVTGKYLSVSGWALSKAGIEKVDAIIDKTKSVELKYGSARNDVYNVFKDYRNQSSGFNGDVDITKYVYGAHSLQLKITYKGGRTQVSTPVSFNISGTLKSNIDSVKQGEVVTGTSLNIGGWALSKVGITKVEAMIDSKAPVEISYGNPRIDVYNAFKDYENKSAGFTGSLDIRDLSFGEHNLKIKAIEANGKVTIISDVKFIVKSSLYCIDTPSSGKSITGNILNISGWAISKVGVEKIEVVVDEKFYQNLQYGLSRPDVYSVFKEYNNQSSGYSGTVDINKLAYGNHNIQVKITDKIGRTTISDVVQVNIMEEKIYAIDSLQKGMSVSGTNLEVSGWVLSKTGITKVEALIDGVAQDVKYGIIRSDVYNIFKNFNNQSSGFNEKVDISKLSYGTHSLVMRYTDARGAVTVSEDFNFNVQNTLKYSIDSPRQGLIIPGNSLVIGGWALSKANITKVEALVDGTPQSLKYGGSRPDVYKAFQDYKNESAGFSGTIDISRFSYGNHLLVIRFTDEAGRTCSSNPLVFNIPNTVKYSIDTPKNNIRITTNTLEIGGWVISRNGIKKVEILVDELVQEIQYGLSRPDVYKVFSEYDNKNSGFNKSIDISKLSNGKHTLVVRFIDGDGRMSYSNKLTVYCGAIS